MLIAAYYILKNRVPYQDLAPDYSPRRNQEAIQRRCVRQLNQMGYEVQLTPKEKAA